MKYISLSQEDALPYMMKGNIFLTGPPGCGKTYLLNKFIDMCHNINLNVAVTGTTGMAAYLLNGTTINSWGGLGLAEDTPEIMAETIKKNPKCYNRWWKTQVLIIDEISMLSKELFEKIEKLARILRRDERPFGGLRVIMSGDFFQLPPVNGEMLFMSPLWEKVINFGIHLIHIYRQKDTNFLKLLLDIRQGNKLSYDSWKTLLKPFGRTINFKYHQPIRLFPRKYEMNKYNKKKLEEIKKPLHIFEPSCKIPRKMPPEIVDYYIKKLDQDSSYDVKVKLKIGAQVLLIKNLHKLGLVNGNVGVVVGWEYDNPIVLFENNMEVVITKQLWEKETQWGSFGRRQIPLILGWALTIHRSQGQTLSSVMVDIGKNVWEKGQSYVAISRASELIGKHNRGLFLYQFHPESIKVSDDVIKYYKKWKDFNDISVIKPPKNKAKWFM